jgi:ATP-dependent DNA helicase RecG
MPRAARAELLAAGAGGRVDLLIGTHALLSEGVVAPDLALAIVDEQHRFGVAQRAQLGGGGARAPHLLVMSATPIPRTLALALHGDLDLSVIDELPPGREPPRSTVHTGARGRREWLAELAAHLLDRGRAFVVCPRIEETGRGELAAVESTAASVEAALPTARVGVLHGSVTPEVRADLLASLRAGTLDVLVCTTVIEVGVDVPEATLMIVLGAERFGLAQLHQLRGRVGRGGGASRCLLVTSGKGDAARRLEAFAAMSDGFRIAELDLALRGPGELLGTRQAGAAPAFAEPGLVSRMHDHARALDEADPALAGHPALLAAVTRLLRCRR